MITRRPEHQSALFRVLILCTTALLYACGGGGGSDGSLAGGPTPPPGSGGGGTTTGAFDGGISGSGQSVGAIQDFGSIIINDDELDTSNSSIDDDGNTSASQSDLKAGQVVSVQADFSNSSASSVVYRSTLKGPIDSINVRDIAAGEADITALGQTIHTNAATNFDNVTLDQLTQGNLIEVSGVRDETGDIVATFIELKQSLVLFKVTGLTQSTNATSFSIGSLIVDFSNATLKDFPNAAPADGQRVEVKADPAGFTAPNNLVADEVEFLPDLAVSADNRLELEGFIDRFVSATDFDVQGFPVTISTAQTAFVNGDSTSLRLGVKVEVEGGVNADGVLEAVKVVIKPAGAIRVEAQIASNTDVDTTAGTITVLGVTFKVRAITRFEDKSSQNAANLTLGDLVAGERVEIRGFLDGETVVATRIEREDTRARARLRGPVTAEDAAAGTVTILNVTVTGVAGTTIYRPLDESQTITQSEFHDLVSVGSFVKADWDNFTATTEVVDELSIED